MKSAVLTAAVALAALLSFPAIAAACAGADVAPSEAARGATARAVVCLVNQERAAHRLAPLRANAKLRTAARRHARDMVTRGYFAHDTPEGRTPAGRAAAYTPATGRWHVGENLAWGAAGHATPRVIVANWMASPSHRANVLRPLFREVGVGIVAGSPRGSAADAFTYASSFGRR